MSHAEREQAFAEEADDGHDRTRAACARLQAFRAHALNVDAPPNFSQTLGGGSNHRRSRYCNHHPTKENNLDR